MPLDDNTPSSSTSLGFKFFGSPPVTPSKFYHSRRPGKHPFAKGFETPQWKLLGLHTVLCLLTFPWVYGFALAAFDASLFWARVVVGVGCGVPGILLGLSLTKLVKPIMEAAGKRLSISTSQSDILISFSAWATVIHESQIRERPGVPLEDLAEQCHTSGPLGALRLLWNRRAYRGAHRKHRKHYE